VLSLLKENPDITTKRIADILSIGEHQAQRIIKKLKDTKRIRHVGSDRSGYGEIVE